MTDKKILLEVCVGTACFVMGSSNLLEDLKEDMPEDLKDIVDIKPIRCLDLCKVKKGSNSPFVQINGEPMDKASMPKVIEKLREAAK
jgi:NADH:ubiquinone oxidoreductase subunit E